MKLGIMRKKVKALEGYKINRSLSDCDSFSSNQEVRFKQKWSSNCVTRNSYRHILIDRAVRAIKSQKYFRGI